MELATCLMCLFFVSVSGADLLDIEVTHKEKECYGTDMGFSFSGTHDYHYESLRRRYAGCTYVQGNLEVTNLMNRNVTYDLSFLSDIKVVTGYVLLGLLNTEVIPLLSLRLIRADTTMQVGRYRYGLIVVLTSEGTPTAENPTPGLKELQMPMLRGVFDFNSFIVMETALVIANSLDPDQTPGNSSSDQEMYKKEITKGDVFFTQNPQLCFVDSIDWSVIGPGRVEMKTDANSKKCGHCHPHCADIDGVRRCWGAGKHMCQNIKKLKCHYKCPGRCYKPGMMGCCHPKCAYGCTGGRDTECEMCKYYRFGFKCQVQCPENTYPLSQECINF